MNSKCQVFTPENYVSELLDSINYKSNIFGLKILENSCGDGNILKSIVQRYIEDGIRKKKSEIEIAKALSRDIYGIEIDEEQYAKCLDNLNRILYTYSIHSENVKWNIYNTDYLTWQCNNKFDFIIGNPPYITYQEIKKKERQFLRENFLSCKKGKFDYCYAFIEKSILSLSEQGKMAYLIPSSIFKTVFGNSLRELMLPHLKEIKDYAYSNIFKDALVKSAIIIIDKAESNRNIKYRDISSESELKLVPSKLTNKWIFSNNTQQYKKRFGDYFQVSHSVATLYNKAFVLKSWKDNQDKILCNNIAIEKDAIKPTATPRSKSNNLKECIIFPYFYKNDVLQHYTDEEFKKKFPGAIEYLNLFRVQLDKRNKDPNARWFEYGRSQALKNLNFNKLLISTVVTNEIKVYELDSDCIPYSGMYITKISDRPLSEAKMILESKEFLQYAQDIGIHISGTSLRITSRDIMNYTFE